MPKKFLFILFLGLAIRFLFIGNTGFLADISFWKSWSLASADHGVVWASVNTNTNYPPAFLYVLWLMGKVYSLFADPHNYNDFWRQNNFAFLFISKSVAIISDTIIACLIYWFFKQKEILKRISNLQLPITPPCRRAGNYQLPIFLSSLFFLNPIVILDSAIWGQVESFGILFTIISIILIFYRRPYLASFIFLIGTMMKLQNIIYIPIFFIFIWRYFDFTTLIKSIAAGTFAFFLINLPFIWQHQMNQVLYLLTVNSDYFPWLSLNAHNLWWIAAAGHGMQVIDKITILGILNAKTVGLLIFSSFYLLFSILVFLKPTLRNFLYALTMVIFAFFLFTTQSHERYSYPVVVLLLFLYPFIAKQLKIPTSKNELNPNNDRDILGADTRRDAFAWAKGKHRNLKEMGVSEKFGIKAANNKYFWIIYTLLTICIFFNIHMGLVVNYPQNGFQIITNLTTTHMGILNSYILIILFLLLLPFIFSQISYLFFLASSFFFLASVIFLNLPYLLGHPISLTSFKPIITKQDFGVLQINKSVNSSTWKTWNRLSNNYFFYRKGFGTHANSTLVFDVNRGFKTFSTDFGVDTEAATPASVIFRINGDSKILFESKKMGRFDYPQHTTVNITGVKYLSLEVTDAGDGINSDHADWLNPVLYK